MLLGGCSYNNSSVFSKKTHLQMPSVSTLEGIPLTLSFKLFKYGFDVSRLSKCIPNISIFQCDTALIFTRFHQRFTEQTIFP